MTAVGDDRFVGILGVEGDAFCCFKDHASPKAARRCARRAARRYGAPDKPVEFIVATLAEIDHARRMRELATRRALKALVRAITGLSEGSAIVSASCPIHPDDPVVITIEKDPA